MFFILNDLLQNICKCAQMHQFTISKKMKPNFMWQWTLSCTLITLPAKHIHKTCTHFLTMSMKCPILPPAPMTTNALLQRFCLQSYSKHSTT
jgi:hypothetical protein